MTTEKINNLLVEMVSSKGFINIDQNDVDGFKAHVSEIDAERVLGKMEEIGAMLDSTMSSIKNRNDNKLVKKILFVISNSSLNFEVSAMRFYTASQRVL